MRSLSSKWRDEYWVKDGRRIHAPVNNATDSVEITFEALSELMAEAGYTKAD